MMKAMSHSSPFSLAGWFADYVSRYRAADGALPAPLELKYAHSRRVAKNARRIARGLKRTDREVLLAEICGLLHDIGRFPQYRRYGSFHDADTIDHGLAGRMTLEDEGAPALLDENAWNRVSCAVEYHNRKTEHLPENLPADSRRLLNIVRDADKLDIMDLALQSVARDGFRALPAMLPHIRLSRELTPAVVEEILQTKTVSVGNIRTVADFLAMLASWFYDFNFPVSRKIAVSRNLIVRLQNGLPDIQVVREILDTIKKEMTGAEERT
jgi:hypothetical protein